MEATFNPQAPCLAAAGFADGPADHQTRWKRRPPQGAVFGFAHWPAAGYGLSHPTGSASSKARDSASPYIYGLRKARPHIAIEARPHIAIEARPHIGIEEGPPAHRD